MCISGCVDSGTSADTWDPKYGASGALTNMFLYAVNANRKASIATILINEKYDETKKISTNSSIIL